MLCRELAGKDRTVMRPFLFIPALLLLAAVAAAQEWQEFRYPDYSFTIDFPAPPRVEAATYQSADGRTVNAHIYSVRREDAEFTVTVAELGDSGLDETAVIGHAVRTLTAGGEVKVDIPHRVNRIYGRQLSVAQGDGSRTAVALFVFEGRLYRIEGRSLPGSNATAETIRFVQSIAFTGGRSNRPGDEIRAARAVCGSGSDGINARLELRCRQSFSALAIAVNSGDLSGARQIYAKLKELQTSANAAGTFAEAMEQLGGLLQRGDLRGAQQALSAHSGGGDDVRR